MSKDFPNEETCSACQCTYLSYDGGPKDRCKAHEDLPSVIEEEVKYKYRDISNQELMARIETLEAKVADLLLVVHKEKPSFTKTCESCKRTFQAAAPAVKKCDDCKKGSK